MLDKYLQLIKDSKNKKKLVTDFLDSINLKGAEFDIVEDELNLRLNSAERFRFKIEEEKVKEFLKLNNLKLKNRL
jgi:hypothetical protein